MEMLVSDLAIGFLVGLAVALVVGWLWKLYRGWIKDMKSPDKPLEFRHPTGETLGGLSHTARVAGLKVWTVRLIVLGAALVLFAFLFPETSQQIGDAVSAFFGAIFG